MPNAEPYSTLETVPTAPSQPTESYSNLQVPIHDGLEIYGYGSDTDEDLSRAAKSEITHRFCNPHRKIFWAMIIAITLAIVALTVGLAVGLTQKNSSTPGSTSIPSPVTRNESAIAAPLLTNSKLSSIAWLDQDKVLQKRVYYQGMDNTIKESSWNASNTRWYISNEAIVKAKNGSSIAAAVTGPPDWEFQINLFILNDTEHINEWYTKDGSSWKPGTVQSQNIVPASITSLTTIWHQHEECLNCPNTNLLVYQDDENKFILGNRTDGGWIWSTLDANPITSSGASLALSWKKNTTAELRLYYQISSGHLCSLDWRDSPANPRAAKNGNWENRESKSLPQIPFNAQIASFTSGTSDSPVPVHLDILSSGSDGITRIWWTSVNGGEWFGPKSPPPMAVVDDYTALAAHKYGNVYAMQDGSVVEFKVESDATSWSRLGEVATN